MSTQTLSQAKLTFPRFDDATLNLSLVNVNPWTLLAVVDDLLREHPWLDVDEEPAGDGERCLLIEGETPTNLAPRVVARGLSPLQVRLGCLFLRQQAFGMIGQQQAQQQAAAAQEQQLRAAILAKPLRANGS